MKNKGINIHFKYGLDFEPIRVHLNVENGEPKEYDWVEDLTGKIRLFCRDKDTYSLISNNSLDYVMGYELLEKFKILK